MTRWVPVLAMALALPASTPAQGAGTISVSGDPPALAVTSAGFGNDLPLATNSSTTYSIFVVSLGMGISGQLDAPMPQNTVLRIALAAPGGATTLGPVPLATTPQTLVRDLPSGNFSSLPITYEFAAQVTAGVIPPSSRTVTLTLTVLP